MAGRRRGRGHPRRQAGPPLPPLQPTNLREDAAVERTSSSSSAAMCGPDVWADLLDSLLHHIIAGISSFHDLHAFIGTCHSWRAALSSLPPAFSFNFPPLHLRPDMGDAHPHHSSVNHILLSDCNWQLVDLAKQTSTLHRLAPQYLEVNVYLLGCSYGFFIFSNWEQCLLVDVYSGATVRPPRLKPCGNHEVYYYGILVAPISSPNSQLLLFTTSSMFQWQVGTSSWLQHPLDCERIFQILFFKGEMLAMDFLNRLHRIHLAPQLTMQEVPTVWEEDTVAGLIKLKSWLVVCGGMLLLVELSLSRNAFFGLSATFKVFCLNFSVKPAKWVKVDNLGNNALFVSFNNRSPTFSCMNPERWGGKSNCIYWASPSADSDEAWSVVELDQVVPCTGTGTAVGCSYRSRPIPVSTIHSNGLQSLWVLPSLVYGDGQ